MRDTTVVLLSVLDGADYLPTQLESLERQVDQRWMLLWRDDGSRDGSVRILEEFAARMAPGRVRRVAHAARRLGIAASFLALLRAAPADAACYAFCDQDDVWLPDKIGRAAAALGAVPAERPALYCARQVMVDRGLRRLGLSPDAKRGPGLANALVQNIATGCTTVLNAAARRHVLSGTPPPPTLHDWWAYLVVTATGGQVIFDPQPEILYRQHGANAVGGNVSKLARAMRALRRGPGAFLDTMAANIDALSACPGLTPEARRTLDALGALRTGSFVARLRTLRRTGLCRQGFREDVLLRLWFTLRPLPRCRATRTVATA
ncbi:glycosyltransferase [Falsiroseomonas sp.]|uniref:glycosyltransferase n=1 Tax=Falsiroseomonas sp. TaxID=2870721 RepID=UPI0035647B69